MTDSTTPWSGGYPVSTPYPPSWHAFQSPAQLRCICATMGVVWDVGPGEPMTIVDVGCGTGYTAAMLAAGCPKARVIGLDYNPAHVAEAMTLRKLARLDNLEVLEADLAAMGDAGVDWLPAFDLITVHGVWSWVDDAAREGVLRLVRRRLKPGGVALVSYNALPGAAGALGLSRLAQACFRAAQDLEQGIDAARRQIERLVAADAAHLPMSGWRKLFTGEAPGARPGYLLHEFMTSHWRPAFFADVADAMSSARCDFVGSATIDENFPQLSLSPEQQALWHEASDEAGRQLVLDLCVPRAFRRDVFVRGLRRQPIDIAADAVWLVATTHTQDELVLRSQAGEAKLPARLVQSIRSALHQGPHSVAQLRQLPGCQAATGAELLAMLIGSGCAAPLWQAPDGSEAWRRATDRARTFNSAAAERLAPHGAGNGNLGLATAALGGGLNADPLELAVAALFAQDPALAGHADVIDMVLTRLLPKQATPPAEMHSYLQGRVQALLRNRLPVWQALGVA